MATGTPTPNLGLDVWNGTDYVLRTEMNSNFSTIDTFAGTAVKSNTANTFTANQTAPAWVAGGIGGSTATSRYVGATASGAPTNGTYAVGDYCIDQTGKVWICTSAGTPGTWTSAGITYTAGTGIGITGSQIANTGVTQVTPGTGISVSPAGGTGNVTVTNSGVTQLTAGPGITLSGSTGNVTISGSSQFNPVISPFI